MGLRKDNWDVEAIRKRMEEGRQKPGSGWDFEAIGKRMEEGRQKPGSGWDFEAIGKRMEERQREQGLQAEKERHEMIEATRLAAQAREAVRAGGLRELSEWARALGVDTGRPAAQAGSPARRALNAARAALGLGAIPGAGERQRRLVEMAEKITRDQYLRESRHEAVKDQLRLKARLAELKEKERQLKEARAREALGKASPPEAPKPGAAPAAAERDAPKRKILGRRGGV